MEKNKIFENVEAMIHEKILLESFQELQKEENIKLELMGDKILVNGWGGMGDLTRKFEIKVRKKASKKIEKLYDFIDKL